MRIYQTLETFAQGYGRRVRARTPAMEPIPFQELLPLKLKDQISSKRDAAGSAACLQEMTVLFSCLKNNEFNQTVCSKEISTFQSCYNQHVAKKAEMKKSTVSVGTKNLTPKQVNAILKKYS